MSDYVIHSTAVIIGEVDSMLPRTRASLAPAKPVPRILDNIDPLAKLELHFHPAVPETSILQLTSELSGAPAVA
jgi:hypothetical protein